MQKTTDNYLAVAADATSDPLGEAYVSDAQPDFVMEWMAARVRAFRFPL